MKPFLIGAIALIGLFNNASAQGNPAEALLHKMSLATEQLNYELSYILVRKNSIEPLRYRHALIDGTSFGQLIYLTGPAREAIRRGDEVSYFEPGIEPFTVISKRMVVPLPSIMHSDVRYLSTLYDFLPLGRSREAGLECDVIRVSSKDGERYSYVLWIDKKSSLLVRADLLDRDGEPIEQFRTLSLLVSPVITQTMNQLAEIELPLVVQLPKKKNLDLSWRVDEVPDGFKPVFSNRHRLFVTERPVESILFSDGLFSFSVYLAKADDLSVRGQLVRKGRKTLHSHVIGNAEITVVGDIPPSTAKKVAESVTFMTNENEDVLDVIP